MRISDWSSDVCSSDLDDRGGDDGDPDRMAAGDGDADHDTDGFDDEPLTADRLIETGDGGADAPLDVDYDAETFHHDSAADTGGYGLDGGLNLDGDRKSTRLNSSH